MRLLLPLILLSVFSYGQKRPLTHKDYDSWKSIGERKISPDGNFAVYTIVPQEGDAELVLHYLANNRKITVSRGYGALISPDSRYVVFKIKPPFIETRQARIKKTKPDDMPQDSLVIYYTGVDSMVKIASVRSFKMPEKGHSWIAWHEDPVKDSLSKKEKKKTDPEVEQMAKVADSMIRRSLESVKGKIKKEEVIKAVNKAVRSIYKNADEQDPDADENEAEPGSKSKLNNLVVFNPLTRKKVEFKNAGEFLFDRNGSHIVIEQKKDAKDSNSKAFVLLYDLRALHGDTIFKGYNDVRAFAFDEDGHQLAFFAERDSSKKALQKFYKLWYYTHGQDTALLRAEQGSEGMRLGWNVNENSTIIFSKDGSKLYFGTSPVAPPKDTTLVDFELARLDIWHYDDDFLQPQQLKQLQEELKKSYTAVLHKGSNKVVQLGDPDMDIIIRPEEGNANWVLALSSKGGRKSLQWEGRQKYSSWIVNSTDGERRQVYKELPAMAQTSPSGKFVFWYDPSRRQYYTYEIASGKVRDITSLIKEPVHNIEWDVPDYPPAAGIIGWTENDESFIVKSMYDIWRVDPTGNNEPLNLTAGFGKRNKTSFTYVNFDDEKRFINRGEEIVLRSFNDNNKFSGFYILNTSGIGSLKMITEGPYNFGIPSKAEKAESYIMLKSDFNSSELFYGKDFKDLYQLTNVSVQQDSVNWFTTELVRWKMFDGKMSEGLLFKPEDFDPMKKYPVIFYFYEKNSDGLFNYRAPAPSASTINIPHFVSNGYLVFDPNIYYKDGEPGESAYNSVVSAAKHLAKLPYVDSNKMGIQGQSWGGYQVAYLVTRTNMFKAASAGAPVSNMTSAYGGIRWGPGMNRQFQYEKQQSRIGATLWERPDLYIKNSPLFAANKINTPLLIMHNDADGAVPWYQGIELFTALRRLDKKVWMLQYNNEDHNLVERKNRKDLSVRLSQFFDHFLKGEKPARWISEGLPASLKGKDWGL